MEKVREEQGGSIRFQPDFGADSGGFGHFVAAMGGLLVPKDHSNLAYQYRQNPEQIKRRPGTGAIFGSGGRGIPDSGGGGCSAGIYLVCRMDVVSEQFAYLENPMVMEDGGGIRPIGGGEEGIGRKDRDHP